MIMVKIKMSKIIMANQPWLNLQYFKLIMGTLIIVKFITVK